MDRTDEIIQIIQTVSKSGVVPGVDESLFDTGILDSFALPDMLAELEDRYGLRIPDSDLNPRKFDTVARIERYVDQAILRRGA